MHLIRLPDTNTAGFELKQLAFKIVRTSQAVFVRATSWFVRMNTPTFTHPVLKMASMQALSASVPFFWLVSPKRQFRNETRTTNSEREISFKLRTMS